jgi:hypothetical protein
LYPEGRTSYKFKNFLRNKVTIIDKEAVKVIAPYVNKTFSYKDFKKKPVAIENKKPEDETTSKIKEEKKEVDDKEAVEKLKNEGGK